jgi:SAM-dependent methyltransferase
MGPAARRWATLVRARREEIERLVPGGGPAGAGFWDRRVEVVAARLRETTAGDPFLARLRRVSGGGTTVVDVGAGTGRFTVALAPRVAAIVAVDPSAARLDLIRADAAELGLTNVDVVEGRWEDADVAPADVVFASYVLPVIDDAPAFVAKLDAVARRHVLVYLGAFTNDAIVDPLWRRFHGRPRRPGPSWLDAVAVLDEMGIEATVEVVEVRNRTRFATVDEAVDDHLDLLALVDTPDHRDELARLLSQWLVRGRGGLRLPVATLPAAVLRWTPTSG